MKKKICVATAAVSALSIVAFIVARIKRRAYYR